MAADFHDEGIPLIRVSGMGGRFVSLDGCNYLSQEKVERQWNHFRVNQGDLLISASASMGTVSEVDDASVGSVPYTGLIRLWPKPGGCISDFIRALVVSDLFGKQIDVLKAGATIQHFGPTHLRQIVVAVPPLEEQKAIAKFLDAETSKIDALVAEQRRLIELLAEKRQAVISHAVTKGLDPNVRMKPSGIEWLGDVPEHWEVTLLKRIAIVRTGVAKGKDHSGKETIEVPYLRVANVQDGFFDLTQVAKIEILEHELERYRLAAGDVLMNEGGDFDKLGRGHVWEGQIDPCITQNHVFAVRPTGVTAHWLNRITSSEYAQFYFMTRSKQSTNLASISSTNLMKLPVVLPPESEQFEILDFIDKSTKQFDSLLAEAEQAITLLQERRTALISAAVTGKIDVRARQY
ncbi:MULTISPECIES: restriction endonuclease subunit S [Pirellulaceae]|nr:MULTISPECIES: restriction endonuclease subunit S [Pirellulaceae]